MPWTVTAGRSRLLRRLRRGHGIAPYSPSQKAQAGSGVGRLSEKEAFGVLPKDSVLRVLEEQHPNTAPGSAGRSGGAKPYDQRC